MEAYFKLTEDLRSNTRLRWGGTCLFQHPGWQHVFWDMEAATQLISTVRKEVAVAFYHTPATHPSCLVQLSSPHLCFAMPLALLPGCSTTRSMQRCSSR